MKKSLIVSLLLCTGVFVGHRAFAVDQGAPYVTAGMTNLADDDLMNANSNFEKAVSIEPAYDPANFLLAATRVLALSQTPAGSNFLTGLGVQAAGRDYYDWTAHPGTNSEGKPEFPHGYNSGAAIAFYTNTLMTAISASLTNLANITDPGFQLYLPGTVSLGTKGSDADDVTVDYGDVQVLRAMLTAAEFVGYSLRANNANVDLSWIETNIQSKTLTIQSLLSQFPGLGSKQYTAAFSQSEQAGTNAIELYFGAASFILNERSVTNALFNLSSNDIPTEIEFQSELTNILLALSTPTQLNSNHVGSTLYLAPYFDGNVSLRSLVPKFSGDSYVPDSVPDYTFGGILPDLPSYETELLLTQKFPNYAGIYIGDGNLTDNQLSSSGGGFAVYVATNGQLTVVGFDNGDGNPGGYTTDGTAFGVFVQATLNKGNWHNSTPAFNAYGNIDKQGDFNGEIDYSNGVSVYLYANFASPLGPFQDSAGYYTGSYSGSSSGPLYAIAAADGEFFFTTGQSGPGGNGGGWSAFYNSDNNFETVEADGTDVYGVLNTNSASVQGTNYYTDPGTFVDSYYSTDTVNPHNVTGIFTNYLSTAHGVFTLSPSSKVPFPVPPAITNDLPPFLTAGLGGTTTFKLGVSGTPPLSYQWYLNSNAVPGATSSTLVVSNNLWTTTGQYYISATVTNVLGGTNSQTCSVGVESYLPPVASYAGVYVGENGDGANGVYDNEFINTNGFAAYISTNGQITVVGQDNGDGNPNDGNNFGIFFQANLTAGGDFQVNTPYFSVYGFVNALGQFFAQMNYPLANNGSGEQVVLVGNLESQFGPFQNSDGLYTGTYSGANSGSLNVIFDANGDIFLLPLKASANGNPYGNTGSGTFSQFYNSTQFSVTSIDGTIVDGALNPGSFVINGTYTNTDNSHGTFTVSRSSKILVPIAPAITTDLPATLTLPLGNLATFHIGVSGSQPLFYEWYLNGAPIAGALTNTLVASNLWTTIGSYQIWAAVTNAAGGTNSRICNVTVTAETNVPTVTITSPVSNELWSNSLFMVTGTASDKLGIVGIICTVNGYFAPSSFNPVNNQWTAFAELTPGSNTISARAENVGFVLSKTNSVRMEYVVNSPLTVITNGMGSINPVYNSTLRVGQPLTLTAAPAEGFQFVNWYDGTHQPLSYYTNNSTVSLTMSNGLIVEANFADTNKPYLRITNALSGMLVNGGTFTAGGVATDDEVMASVNYSLNGVPYGGVSTANGWTNWAATLSLAAGTNLFSVYALATNGNSITDSVDIVSLSSNLLTVQTSGKGTISPNYSNAVLRVGQNYSMTAAPASGFVFTNWTGSTNGTFVLYGNKPSVTFMMFTGLTMQANFKDTLKPYLKITNSLSEMVITNTKFKAIGVATDDEQMTFVTYSLNGAATNEVSSFDGWSNWVQTVSVAAGTNVLSIYATATNGNMTTDTVTVVSISTNQLYVQMSGKGTISPNYSNALLNVGENYTINAAPASGFVFNNWTGATNQVFVLYSKSSTLKFMMETGLVLQANFTDTLKPYLKITNAISGMLWTNSSFTVMGVATDDEAIASVNYSLNGSEYEAVNPGNGWTNWSQQLTLNEGTNKFAVYALATNGNTSATNTITILRQPAVTLFAIATNMDIVNPQAQISFDGTNYLVVYQAKVNNSGQPEGQFVAQDGTLLGAPIALNPSPSDNDPPWVDCSGTNYLVAWDNYSASAVDGVFVTSSGTVSGVTQFSQSTSVDKFGSVVYGGGVYFLMWPDKGTSPDSIYGAIISPLGNAVSGDFLISTNGTENEAGQGTAAFDGTNFLAVWFSATGKTSIKGQLIDTTGNLVGNPIVVYTNSAVTGDCTAFVKFDGSNYLVLFDPSFNPATSSSSIHVLGRFVTTAGQVLTNQITLTSDTGPQIVADGDFGPDNSLYSWNQGFNPFAAANTSATVNGRFFNFGGSAISAEFPIFTTLTGNRIPTFAPVLFDGSKYVLVTGLGKEIGGTGVFTNCVIYGAFVSP